MQICISIPDILWRQAKTETPENLDAVGGEKREFLFWEQEILPIKNGEKN